MHYRQDTFLERLPTQTLKLVSIIYASLLEGLYKNRSLVPNVCNYA